MLIALTISFINAAVVAVLLNAAMTKAVNPDQPRRALQEVLPLLRQYRLGRLPGRITAIVEIIAALALTSPPTRLFGALMIAMLGVAYIAIGVLGIVRGASVPCGCVGDAARGHPFGAWNIGAGLLITAAALANGSESSPFLVGMSYLVWTAVLAGTLSIAIAVWLHRPLFRLLSVSDATTILMPVTTPKEKATW